MPVKYHNNDLILLQREHQVPLKNLVKKINQPFFLYDLDGILHRLKEFQKYISIADIYFSMKCNNHPDVLKTFLKQNCGLDIVSGGEFKLGLKLNCSAKKMVFSGVGKTKQELELAIRSQIFQINVESLQELDRIGQICQQLNQSTSVAFRINPNIALDTHAFIQTGTSDHKFGMEEKFLPDFLETIKKYSPLLKFQGLAMHIGSQGLSVDPILEASRKIKQIYERLNREGYSLTTIDIGGGVGIDYQNQDSNSDLERIRYYGSELQKIFQNTESQILCEPGRILTARYAWLFGEVQYIKQTSSTTFAILNTGMHHLIRPALYQSYHHILPIQQNNQLKKLYTLAGPICESTDILARDRMLYELQPGDWLAFCDVGAYGSVMSQNYNLKEPALELSYSKGKCTSSYATA